MCGIAGWIAGAGTPAGASTLEAMAASMAHRGPDDEGFLLDTPPSGSHRVGLAHRRLSILDLEGGHQPMRDASGALAVVYNGEIYNFRELRVELESAGHRFRTRGDTEVLLAAYEAWGDAFVERLRGMFAFALWDRRREQLLLARDRFGQKPLFLRHHGEELVFASEMKALREFPGFSPRVDRAAVWDYLAYRYVPGPRTMLEGVEKLPPGTIGVWRRGKWSQRRYYRSPDRLPPAGGGEGNGGAAAGAVAGFLERLDEAVRIRMVCDVPYGAFLSGGIDSSAVVALMVRHSRLPVKTFSVGFAESAYSELPHAREIAELFETDHHELVITEESIVEHLPALVRFRDAPVSEPSDVPIYLLAREAARSVKMVLTGEGGDEFLGGYPKHVFEGLVPAYQRLPRVLRSRFVEPLVRALPYRFRRAKTAIATMGLDDPVERLPRWFGALSPGEREQLAAFSPEAPAPPLDPFDVDPRTSPLRRLLFFDQMSWLPDNLLERGDRMTMAASIEARMPLVDHELAAFVSALPDRLRVRGRSTKWILRRSVERILPARILRRPKVGFRVPVNDWFRGPMRDFLLDHICAPSALAASYCRRDVVEKIVGEHLRGRQNHEKLLWTLLNLEIWHRECLRQRQPA